MGAYNLYTIFLVYFILNITKGESGYDSLDPWEDLPKTYYNSGSIDDVFELEHHTDPEVDSTSYDEVLAYYTRLINLIFKRSAFKTDDDDGLFIRNIYLQMSHDQFSRILDPIKNTEDLRKVDGVISDIFSKCDGGFSEKANQLFESWYQKFCDFTEKPFVKAALIISIFLCTLIYLRFVSELTITKISVILLLVVAYGWTYYDIYMEMEINRLVELRNYPSPPKECTIEAMTFYEKFLYKMTKSLSSDVCKDYYMLTSVTTFEVINPAIVAVEMITRLFTQPLSTASEKLGQGLTTLFMSIPWPWSIVLFPIALVFFLIILIFFACYGLGIHVNFNIFHLLSFSIGSQPPKPESSSTLRLEDIAIMANALRDAQLNQIANSNLQSLEQKLLEQCEHILRNKDKNVEQVMIKEKEKIISEQELTKISCSSKNENSSKVAKNSLCETSSFEENIENIDSTNYIKSNSISKSPKEKYKNARHDKMKTKGIVDDLMENINDMENRLERANRVINAHLVEMNKNNVADKKDH